MPLVGGDIAESIGEKPWRFLPVECCFAPSDAVGAILVLVLFCRDKSYTFNYSTVFSFIFGTIFDIVFYLFTICYCNVHISCGIIDM